MVRVPRNNIDPNPTTAETKAGDQWRFRWIENDIKDMKEAHKDLCDLFEGQSKKLSRVEILLWVILAAGVSSKVFSAEIADIMKALIGV